MTDIVKRLRACQGVLTHDPECNCEEAADEIERLRDHMRALADTSVDRDTAGIFKGLWHGSEKECDELRDEIERLRMLVSEGADALRRLATDNTRLRAALQAIAIQALATHPPHEYASRALEPKP